MEVTKKDLEGLLTFLTYGSGDNAVMVKCEYLEELARLALKALEE